MFLSYRINGSRACRRDKPNDKQRGREITARTSHPLNQFILDLVLEVSKKHLYRNALRTSRLWFGDTVNFMS